MARESDNGEKGPRFRYGLKLMRTAVRKESEVRSQESEYGREYVVSCFLLAFLVRKVLKYSTGNVEIVYGRGDSPAASERPGGMA